MSTFVLCSEMGFGNFIQQRFDTEDEAKQALSKQFVCAVLFEQREDSDEFRELAHGGFGFSHNNIRKFITEAKPSPMQSANSDEPIAYDEAWLYRTLASDFTSLPTPTELKKKHPGLSEAADEQKLLALFSKVDALSSSLGGRRVVVDECVRRMRASGDGGEADLDQTIEETARVVPIDGWQGEDGQPEWILPEKVRGNGRSRLLFLHGGGYEYYSPSNPYRPFTTRLAKITSLPVLAIDYRLAPKHPFPAALHDGLYALSWVWKHGPPPVAASGADGGNGGDGGDGGAATSPHWTDEPAEAVYVCGDSAGGGLSLALISALAMGELAPGVPLPAFCEGGVPLPTALGLISPWTDLSASLPSYRTRAWDEATSTGDLVFSDGNPDKEIRECVEGSANYGGKTDLADPRVSPVFLDAALLKSHLPPTLLVVGDAEVMLCDSTELAARAADAKVPPAVTASQGVVPRVSLRIYRRMWHVFPMYTEACGQEAGKVVWSREPGEVGDALVPALLALEDLRDWLHLHEPSGKSPRKSTIAAALLSCAPVVLVELMLLNGGFAGGFAGGFGGGFAGGFAGGAVYSVATASIPSMPHALVAAAFIVANSLVRLFLPSSYCPRSQARSGILASPLLARFLATGAELVFYAAEADALGLAFWPLAPLALLTYLGETLCWLHVLLQMELLGALEDTVWTIYQGYALLASSSHLKWVVALPYLLNASIGGHLYRQYSRALIALSTGPAVTPFWKAPPKVGVVPDAGVQQWATPSLLAKPVTYALVRLFAAASAGDAARVTGLARRQMSPMVLWGAVLPALVLLLGMALKVSK